MNSTKCLSGTSHLLLIIYVQYVNFIAIYCSQECFKQTNRPTNQQLTTTYTLLNFICKGIIMTISYTDTRLLTLNTFVAVIVTDTCFQELPCVPLWDQVAELGRFNPYCTNMFRVSTCCPYMWYQNVRHLLPVVLAWTCGLISRALSPRVRPDVSMKT